MQGRRCPVVVGHRANTLGRLRRYTREGAGMVEVDLALHNGDLVIGHVEERDAGSPIEGLGYKLVDLELGRRVRLNELPRILPASVGVWLDLKSRITPRLLGQAAGLLEGRTIAVSTRWHTDIPGIREALPGAIVFASIDHRPSDPAGCIKASGADGVTIRFAYVDEELTARIHSTPALIAVWTVNSRDKVRRALELNVDYIITDRPAIVAKACGEGQG